MNEKKGERKLVKEAHNLTSKKSTQMKFGFSFYFTYFDSKIGAERKLIFVEDTFQLLFSSDTGKLGLKKNHFFERHFLCGRSDGAGRGGVGAGGECGWGEGRARRSPF